MRDGRGCRGPDAARDGRGSCFQRTGESPAPGPADPSNSVLLPKPARRQKDAEGPSPAASEPHAPAAPMASRKAPAGAGSGLAAAGRDRERERAHLELAELGPLLEEKGDQGPTGAASVRPSETPGREGIRGLAQSPRSVPADYPGNLPVIPLIARGVRLQVVPRAGPCSQPAQTLLLPSRLGARVVLAGMSPGSLCLCRVFPGCFQCLSISTGQGITFPSAFPAEESGSGAGTQSFPNSEPPLLEWAGWGLPAGPSSRSSLGCRDENPW